MASLTFEEHPEIVRRFPDLHPPFTAQAAVVESDRCLNCFDAPCTGACPTHIDVPRFIKKIASGNLRGSAKSILEANVLAASCSRVCPVDVLCEGACVLHRYNQQPIAIGRLQRHSMDSFHAAGGTLKQSAVVHRQKIACIGAGPASLAAAAELRQRGFAVTVFDKRALPGGLNTYGVAEYKLPTSASLREIELIVSLGVEFRFGVEIHAAMLAEIEANYDIVFLGVGLGSMHRLDIPGGHQPGVLDALQFIEDYKLGTVTTLGEATRVVVIGAGNTAIDAACAARRLGAEDVRIVYRRTREHISAFEFEYEHARHEGIQFEWGLQPLSIHAVGGKLHSIECAATELDAAGRLTPLLDRRVELLCDLVIPAIGQSPLLHLLGGVAGLEIHNGRVVVDRATGQTTHPKFFAGGDCINGGREVVDAVADGKRAAVAIAAQLENAYA